MVVDDDPRVRKYIRKYLGHDGHTIIEAENGIEAIMFYNAEPVDLIITDNNMPGMMGIELARKMQQIHGTDQCPVILMSGDDLVTDELADFGISTFIKKPFEYCHLKLLMAKLLENPGHSFIEKRN